MFGGTPQSSRPSVPRSAQCVSEVRPPSRVAGRSRRLFDSDLMRIFDMCRECSAEYLNPRDRRFHAQPNACPKCGPHLELRDEAGDCLTLGDDALQRTAAAIRDGMIVAVKGLGGFHLMVDAANEAAVG